MVINQMIRIYMPIRGPTNPTHATERPKRCRMGCLIAWKMRSWRGKPWWEFVCAIVKLVNMFGHKWIIKIIYIYVYTYTCFIWFTIHVYVYIICLSIHTFIYVCMYIYIFMCNIYTYINMYVCIYVYIYIHILPCVCCSVSKIGPLQSN